MGRDPAGAGSTPAGHPQARSSISTSRTRVAEHRALTPDGQGSSPWRRTSITPRGGTRQTHRSQKPAPAGMSVRLGPRGPFMSPIAQRQSSALIRRRPVDRHHPGLPMQGIEKPLLAPRAEVSNRRAARVARVWLAKSWTAIRIAAGVRSARSPPVLHAGVAQGQSSRLLTGRTGFDTLRPHSFMGCSREASDSRL